MLRVPEIGLAEPVGDTRLARSQLQPRFAVDKAETREVAQPVHDFAALVGRPEHDHPPEVGQAAVAQVLAHEDSAERMGDKMLFRVRWTLRQRRLDRFDRELLDPGAGRRIADVDYGVAAPFEFAREPGHRPIRTRETVQQDDAIRGCRHCPVVVAVRAILRFRRYRTVRTAGAARATRTYRPPARRKRRPAPPTESRRCRRG